MMTKANAEYELAMFHKQASTDRKLHMDLAPSETEHSPAGQWFQRGATTFGASPGDPYPISQKQYGFIMGLISFWLEDCMYGKQQ